MNFTVARSSFAEALEQLQGAVDRKTTIPILSHCLVDAEPQGVRLAATDLELGIRLFCPAKVETTGSRALPARRLLDIVKSLPEGELRVHARENERVQISAGRSAFKFATMAKDNFPAMPEVPQPIASVPASTLRGLIDRTAFAISNQDGRYALNTALLVLKPDRVEMFATDGSRLSLAGQGVQADGLKGEERLLIPRRALGLLRRLAGAHESGTPIAIANDDSHLFFGVADSILIARRSSGDFPKYEAILPQSNGINVTEEAGDIREALARVSLLASEHNHGISLMFEPGRVTLSTTNSDAGEAIESVDASYQGEPLRVGFNCLYLLDFFDAVKTGRVEIALKDEQSAAEFRPTDSSEYEYRYIVMPMRV